MQPSTTQYDEFIFLFFIVSNSVPPPAIFHPPAYLPPAISGMSAGLAPNTEKIQKKILQNTDKIQKKESQYRIIQILFVTIFSLTIWDLALKRVGTISFPS